jgi:hypothetical protein
MVVAKRARATQRAARTHARKNAGGEYFRELPDLVRHARARVADAPDALRHLADSLETAIHDFGTDDEPARLESASVQILAGSNAAGIVLIELAVFAGRLTELARALARAKLG